MATYEYRCPSGHITELVLPMADEKPESILCEHRVRAPAKGSTGCRREAKRVWEPWAATIYRGSGTYTTDYKLKYDRKRRKNPGDALPTP